MVKSISCVYVSFVALKDVPKTYTICLMQHESTDLFKMLDLAQTAQPTCCSKMFQVEFWHAAAIGRK